MLCPTRLAERRENPRPTSLTSLGSLGCSLLHIIDFFPNVEFSEQDQRTVTIRSEVEMEVKMMAKEVSALASCNRALRRRLLPITSATFPIGSLGKYKGVLTQFEKLASLASKGDEMLACVRSVPCFRRLAPTRSSPLTLATQHIQKPPCRVSYSAWRRGRLRLHRREFPGDPLSSLSPSLPPILAENAAARERFVARTASRPSSHRRSTEQGSKLHDARLARLWRRLAAEPPAPRQQD